MLLSILSSTARGKPNNFIKQMLNEVRSHQSISKMSAEQKQMGKYDVETVTTAFKGRQTPPQLRRDKQNQAAKKKTVPYIPGIVNLQVLGAGANGAPCSVYLFTDQARYLFNCGEGTQRLAHEHKTKLSRLEHIFVTRNTWPVIGGFPGLALTVQDAGVRELALHGPPYLDSILHSMKRFVVLKSLQVKTKDCTKLKDYEDAVMSVKYVPLYKNTEDSNNEFNKKVVIAYICTLKPRPGALNLEKCVEHGVPPGPLLGLLKNGIDVTLDNGIVVKSKYVSEPSETALSFIFLDIPDVEYFPALQANTELFHAATTNNENDVGLIIHFSPAHILKNNSYQIFIKKFSTKTQHLYLNSPNNKFSGYIAAHRIQYQLNQLNPRVFPLLAESTDVFNSQIISNKLKKTKLVEIEEEALRNGDIVENPNELSNINSLTNFHLRPRKGIDRSLEAKLIPNEYITETQVLEGFPSALAKLKEEIKNVQSSYQTEDYPKITFLGTGSCIPNKTRNVSSILVQPHERSYILLDCGEGTFGQIMRFYGKSKAEEVMRNLKAIYVSHLHADHHIGLIGLLEERKCLLKDGQQENKLLLFAPKQIEPWLNFYDESIKGIRDSYELIGNAEMLENPLQLLQTHEDMGVSSIATCLVRHCPHSFGVSLQICTNNKPVKITYSGDSMPCQDLIDLGRNSTILIHEATMEDDLIEEAKLKMHSTISQAIKQGREMQAEHIILTHFSQRYAKLPRMQNVGEEAEAQVMKNVAIAFDNMQVTLAELQNFHLLYPALKALFAEHAEELEQKALKRELKLERKRKLINAD